MPEIVEQITEDTISLISNQNTWGKKLRNWALGISWFSVSAATAIPVAVINNWKKSNIFNFSKGIYDFLQNPQLFIVPEITTTVLVTGVYKVNEKLVNDLFNNQISNFSKLKSLLKKQSLSLIFIGTNELFKKINEKLVTSSPIDISIFNGWLQAIGWDSSKALFIIIVSEFFKVWWKGVEGIDCYSIAVPIMSLIVYLLGNALQTLYLISIRNKILTLENFNTIFLVVLAENTVNGIFRLVSNSIFFHQLSLLCNNGETNDSISEINEPLIPADDQLSIQINHVMAAIDEMESTIVQQLPLLTNDSNDQVVANIMPTSQAIDECQKTISPPEKLKQADNYKFAV